jgi:cytochrome P450
MDILELINQTNHNKKSNSKLLQKARLFNPFDGEYIRDPYPIYHRLRETEPVHKSLMGVWILTRYDDVNRVLHDNSLFTAKRHKSLFTSLSNSNNASISDSNIENPATQFAKNVLLWIDPPQHTRVRNLAAKVFKDYLVNGFSKKIEAIIDELLEKLKQKKSEIDLLKDLAQPLPIKIIADIMGIPKQDIKQLKKWADQGVKLAEYNISSSKHKQEIISSIVEYSSYMSDLIEERRQNPQSDFISKLVTLNDKDQQITQEELMSVCLLFFPAGEVNTGNQIANCLLTLLRFPEQIEKINTESIPTLKVVEELIRYDSSVQGIIRSALADVKMGNQLIREGQQIILMLGAANRDPQYFPNPDKLDFTRQNNNHLAFISGIHTCLGKNLALLEMQILFKKIMPILSNFQLTTDQIDWQESAFFRGPKKIPVIYN